MRSRRRWITALAVIATLMLTGCVSKATSKMLGSLGLAGEAVADFLTSDLDPEAWPGGLADLTSDGDRGLYIWSGSGQPDEQLQEQGYVHALLYEVEQVEAGLAVDARLRASGYSGGGFRAESDSGYLCVEYTVSPDLEISRRQVDCPEIIKPGSDSTRLVSLHDVLNAGE